MRPQDRAALVETALSVAAMVVMFGGTLLAYRYAPQLAVAGRAVMGRYRGRRADPGGLVDELAVSEFRASIPREMDPQQWEKERWGWNS